MVWLLRYIRGFIAVEISGANAEELLNIAARNRIVLWDLKCHKLFITGKMSIKDFKKIYNLRKIKTNKIRIIGKYGLPFKIEKNKKRAGFFVGFAVFFALLVFLSQFVWSIKTNGNVTVKNSEILTECRSMGIYEGIPKKKLKEKNYSQLFLLNDERFAWCSFNLEGSVLTVDVTEVARKESDNMPTDIKAKIGGEIIKIDVTSGSTVCKVGDTVLKGDLLVSGIIESLDSTVFTGSKGSVIAKTYREYSKTLKYSQEKYVFTGESEIKSALKIFGFKIPLYLGEEYNKASVKTKTKNAKLFGEQLPITLLKKIYLKKEKKTVNYSKEKLIEMGNKMINKEIEKCKPIEYQLVKNEVVDTSDGITLTLGYNCIENIAKSERILLDTKN